MSNNFAESPHNPASLSQLHVTPRNEINSQHPQADGYLLIDNKRVLFRGRLLTIAALRSEYYEFVDDPHDFIAKLQAQRTGADLFTFLQRPSDSVPRYDFHLEWQGVAVLSITTYENWWKNQINDKTRNMIRKAQKKGVQLRLLEFNDELVRGIKEIYDESPLRQGKPFVHYRKDFETLKRAHVTFLERSDFIGAFKGQEMIGILKITHGKGFSSVMQIVSKVGDRDKAPTNALLARTVELCAERNIPLLHYGIWFRRGLTEFKKHHGFAEMNLPRYFVPLSLRGKIGLKLKLHRNPIDVVPGNLQDLVADWRTKWYTHKYRHTRH